MEPDLPEIDSGDEDLVLVGCNGACKGRSFPIRSLPCSIGRASGNDLPLAGDGTASGRHCRIDRAGGRLWIEDVGSKNQKRPLCPKKQLRQYRPPRPGSP